MGERNAASNRTLLKERRTDCVSRRGIPGPRSVSLRATRGRRIDVAEAPQFERWPKDALYRQANELEIDGRSKMTRTGLIDALRSQWRAAETDGWPIRRLKRRAVVAIRSGEKKINPAGTVR